jgi:hypothetical protein
MIARERDFVGESSEKRKLDSAVDGTSRHEWLATK